jgi:hypothetical protein
MRTLPIDASVDDIRNLVVEWNELLAQRRYRDALELFPFSTDEFDWTPEVLENVISGYGVFDMDRQQKLEMLAHHGVPQFAISTLAGRPDKDQILARMDVDRWDNGPDDDVIGDVHYFEVPLSGFRSDLTARFNIKRVGSDRLTLEFYDIHVM